MSPNSTFFIFLGHEDSLDQVDAFYQVAYIYTSSKGDRILTVHTLKQCVTMNYSTLFKECDLESSLVGLTFKVVEESLKKGLSNGRKYIEKSVLSLLSLYRKKCGGQSHSGQLLLPEQLKLYPLYAMCLAKTSALSTDPHIKLDDRINCLFKLYGLTVHNILNYLYPRLFDITNLAENEQVHNGEVVTGSFDSASNTIQVGLVHPVSNHLVLPQQGQLTSDLIMKQGIYLLEDLDARKLYLWIGSQVPDTTLFKLFGISNRVELGIVDAPQETWHWTLKNITQHLLCSGRECTNHTYRDISLVIMMEDNASLEDLFFARMLEDIPVKHQTVDYTSPSIKELAKQEDKISDQSYSEFLTSLHHKILNE